MLLPTVPRTRVRAAARPVMDTPFGAVAFTTTIGDTALPPLPDELFALPGGRTVARWRHHAARVELLLTPYDPELDPEVWGPLTDCLAAVWRIDAGSPPGRVTFSAGLPARLPDGADAGWDGGQGLAAVTVDDGTTRLTLGGPDEEGICHAAATTAAAPRRWAGLIGEVYRNSCTTWGVDFADHHGMTWTLPPLEAGDHCELPVVAAWTSVEDETENTWYAVGSSSTVLLRQVVDSCMR